MTVTQRLGAQVRLERMGAIGRMPGVENLDDIPGAHSGIAERGLVEQDFLPGERLIVDPERALSPLQTGKRQPDGSLIRGGWMVTGGVMVGSFQRAGSGEGVQAGCADLPEVRALHRPPQRHSLQSRMHLMVAEVGCNSSGGQWE